MQTTTMLGSLRAWTSGLRLLRDPERLDDVFVLADVLEDPAVLDLARRSTRGREALHRRHRLPPYSIATLRACPDGSLGRELAELLDARGLDPASLPRRRAASDEEYLRAHLHETHDHWHVALGERTDIAGELAVQAFYFAQLRGALPPVLITGGLLHGLLWDRDDWSRRFEAIQRGYERGRRAEPLFGVRWDETWSRPLADVRAELGLSPQSIRYFTVFA
jgi:ubiquinone biosynthesis protein COQ4